MSATIDSIRKVNGIAGQIAYTVQVTRNYENDISNTVTSSFIGTTYGNPGPVLMTFDTGGNTWVIDPARFGDTLNPQWIRNFYA